MQVDGKMEVNSVGPHFTGHDDEAVDEEDIAKFYDDVTGKMVPGHLVRAARQEEIKFLNTFPVYKKVPEVNAKGKERVSVRWCDVNKGDRDNMVIRSMFFTRFRPADGAMDGSWTSSCSCWTYPEHISTPPAVRELYITLPDEDATPGMVGQLLRTLCGTRDAAHEWDDFAKTKISALGYQVGMSNPCLYVHGTEPSIGWRHGDDILFAGEEEFVDSVYDKLKGEMIIKKRALLGFAEKDDKHCTILNRLIDFTVGEDVPVITYEPDPRHVDLLLEHMGLEGAKVKGVSTPGEKFGMYYDETELEKSSVTLYRSCVMRLQFCANRLARGMAKPTRGHWNRLKRAVRYLKMHGRWVRMVTDSDWAGDKIDRKSVSCVVTLIGGHCIRCQTATQTVPALSSGEAEYVGNVKGGSVGIGMQSMARDFGDERVVRIATASSASKGIASRLGLGKIRHLDTGLLWLQHHVRRKVLQLVKTAGNGNPADIGTKDLAEKDMKRIMVKLGFQERTRRHPKALCISGGAGSPAPTEEEEGLSQLTARS